MDRNGPRPAGVPFEALIVCFLLSAVIGTVLDGIHAYGDVLSYPSTAFGRWAWFVPLEFGLVGVAAGLVAPALERLGGAHVRFSMPNRLLELFFFTGLYALTALVGDDQPVLLACGLLALAFVRLVAAGAPGDWLYVVAAMLVGPAGEALLTALGVFDYASPDVAGIPVWLPGLWANGGFLVRRLILPVVAPRNPGGTRARTADSSSPLRSP